MASLRRCSVVAKWFGIPLPRHPNGLRAYRWRTNECYNRLDKILPRQIKGGAAQYYNSLSRAEWAQKLEEFKTYTQAFDRKYGTKLWYAAVRAGVTRGGKL
jgi:hypothetical protein